MKLFVITKKHLIIASCLVIALTLSVVGATSTFAQSNRKLPIYCVETEKKQIAISFDAAWGNSKKVQNNIFKSLYIPFGLYRL